MYTIRMSPIAQGRV